MSNVSSVKLKWNTSKISSIDQNLVRGMIHLGYDIAAQARRNAPYQTGALRNSIRVEETTPKTIEVIAGGGRVPYALRREYENNLHPDTTHYMERATKTIMVGNYMQKYFGDIIK